MKTQYDILGIEKDASQAEVVTALVKPPLIWPLNKIIRK